MANTRENNDTYLKKVVYYEGKPVTLYSLDGVTWSSNKDDLAEIQARLVQAKLKILGLPVPEVVRKDAGEPAERVREVSRKAKRVRDISKSIIEIKAEEIRSQLRSKDSVTKEAKRTQPKRAKKNLSDRKTQSKPQKKESYHRGGINHSTKSKQKAKTRLKVRSKPIPVGKRSQQRSTNAKKHSNK